MKLYDEVIAKSEELFAKTTKVKLPIEGSQWPEVTDQSMILRSDMAYELGGGLLPAIGNTIITGNADLVSEDSITLIGKDLYDFSCDAPYARIAFVRVDEDTLGQGESLYRAIRNFEYTRYHYYPEGFMLRVSSTKQRECVRVGKKALEQGLNFTITGNRFIEALKKNSSVKAVSLYYITEEGFDYKTLQTYMKESEEITKTIDHIMKNVIMDCKACSLQEICDEVEGLRELHFAK